MPKVVVNLHRPGPIIAIEPDRDVEKDTDRDDPPETEDEQAGLDGWAE